MSEETQFRELELRAVRVEEREVDYVCSTETVDSYGTILKANWDLKRFKRNPVVLFAHEGRQLPVGKAKNVSVVGNELHATIKFATSKASPIAEMVFQSVAVEDMCRGISVGFYPREVREEKVNDKWVVILDDNELRELSIAPVPSNPDALAKLRARIAGELNKTEAHPAPKMPADERGESKETSMTPEEIAALKKQNEERAAQITTIQADLLAARATATALETQNVALVKERDALKERAEKAEKADLERHVDSFVGVKITKAEREANLELARTNRPLFDKLMEQRSDLPTKVGAEVMGDPSGEEKRTHTDAGDGADDGASLFASIKADAKKAGV